MRILCERWIIWSRQSDTKTSKRVIDRASLSISSRKVMAVWTTMEDPCPLLRFRQSVVLVLFVYHMVERLFGMFNSMIFIAMHLKF